MAFPIPSRYQPIWDTLKQKHVAKLVAPEVLHRRIIKAVTKRKNVDLAYKVLCGEQHRKAVLNHSTEGNTITFSLTFIPYYNATGAY